MALNIRSRFRRSVRALARLLFYIFLFSLPITFFPLASGIFGAVKFHFWSHGRISENSNALIFETEQHNRMSYWNVPGAQTIHQFQDNKEPFFLPQLRAMDWTDKLSVTKPDQYPEEDPRLDRLGNLDDLVRRISLRSRYLPTEYWAYVTFWPTLNGNEWDKAFNQILEASYLESSGRSPSFLYLDCIKSQFLCGIWGVKTPSLVHFTVENQTLADLSHEDEDEHPQLWHHYDSPPEMLQPVTARVIELPLEGEDAVHFLPRNVLPTPYLQLRTLIFDAPQSAIVEYFEPWATVTQTLRRFQDRMDDLFERPGTRWHTFHKADDWYVDTVLKPVFGKDVNSEVLVYFQSFAFTITYILTEIVRIPFSVGWSLYSWYFGLGWDGEPLGTHEMPSPDDGSGGGGMFDDMMADFWDFAAKNMAEQAADASAHAAVTEAAESI